ncbi:MAG: hypothetical protein V3U84_07750 [Thiotrichaceae bacterium]
MQKIKQLLIPFTFLLLILGAYTLQADNDFAEKHVVLQISDASRQNLVLNVANNLQNHYGPDKVAIEIVAFGPGLKSIFAKNEVTSPRVSSLAANGVKFSACMNTIAAIKRKTGKEPIIHKDAGKVPAGVVRIMDLVDKGYTLIKP